MSDNEVRQSNNSVAGDQAGRDINKPTSNLTFTQSKINISYMSSLLNKFQAELDGNVQLNAIIEDLNYYRCPYKDDVVGLEKKLRDGNREDFIDFALRTKERFHKKLVKYQLYESAQRINVHLLSMVVSYFENHIKPRILNGHSSLEVGSLIQEFIVNPLLNELEENHLGFTAEDINGMLYFLTGNCHIKWAK
jgi:hypothetical protein